MLKGFASDKHLASLNRGSMMKKTVYVGHRINFSTKEPNGLLLWQGDMDKNWVAIGIYDDFLEFQMQQYLMPATIIRSRYLCYKSSTF
jgi:hypothetical protein